MSTAPQLSMLALIALLSPAAAALLLVPPWLRARGMPAALLSLAASAASLVAASLILLERGAGSPAIQWTLPWLRAGGRTLCEVGVNVDGVSAAMLLVVTVVASCVQLFSIAYMHDEAPRGFGRYFAFHALFLFAMNTLVLAPNLLQLFIGWELVGLASYLLIGFYFAKPSAARAAVKAFWMTKLADMGFLFGLLYLFVQTGSFAWTAPATAATATIVTALFFFAVMGKSAQFPLHVWLPDAMEGPTPVSALLHAATMVAAGVFLVVRADPLFALAPLTREGMVWIGAATAVFAALLALVQKDLKKVLAFSTCSQLGYMVTALGAGSAFAGFFHLGTHAFFKALLFLAAGSVIHAVHSNNLEDMSGLRKKMPLTTAAFAVGALSLCGVPGFAGFFSKDLVLSTVQGHTIPWLCLLASTFLTAFYMGRVLIKAFGGEPSEKASHAHEAGLSITLPLVVLMVPSLLAGFLGAWLARGLGVEYEFHFLEATPLVASALALAGLGAAVVVYGNGRQARWTGLLERLDRASAVDRTWELLYGGSMLVSWLLGWIDRYIVDGLINLAGYVTLEVGSRVRRLQTGLMRDYLTAVVVAAILLVMLGGAR